MTASSSSGTSGSMIFTRPSVLDEMRWTFWFASEVGWVVAVPDAGETWKNRLLIVSVCDSVILKMGWS